ncbi:hypothetical protein EV44_g3601 [Erysiphe necator]|uniref:Uncharacterized protein n=1 Tax=Uncinula necator TaxID=52586 RepID=A0A0B1P6T1_UNCNE|nr:hypothetical protein EV44_g3601 [Erysiphe necator]
MNGSPEGKEGLCESSWLSQTCRAYWAFTPAPREGEGESEDFDFTGRMLQRKNDNSYRGLKFVQLDKTSLELFIVTHSSFANNTDHSYQIDFVIVLADCNKRANILHWSSIKCRRVKRSVLAAELYGVVYGFDVGSVIKASLKKMLEQHIPLTLCTDSKPLFEFLVKLGSTQEKRLMVDLMSLRQSYERRELTHIRWIRGDSNPADAMTKSKCSNALKRMIDKNNITVDSYEWVERNLDNSFS